MEIRAPECCIIREGEGGSVPHHFGETGSKSDHRSALDGVVVLEVLDGATELELLQSRSSKEPGDHRNKSDPHFDDKPSNRLDLFYKNMISPSCMHNEYYQRAQVTNLKLQFMSWLALRHLLMRLQIPVSRPPADGCTAWLVDREEGGGANFPPGGGGRRPRPPELWGRVLSFFLDCWKLEENEMREQLQSENELELQIYGAIWNL